MTSITTVIKIFSPHVGRSDNNVEEYSHRQSRHANLVLTNAGNASFTNFSARAGQDMQLSGRHRGAAFGDFDGDGRVDAVVTRIGEAARLFRNTSATTNQWIGIRLRGTRSNRQGLGAMVRVTATSGRQQWNRVTTAVGYASSERSRRSCSVWGEDCSARQIEIRWPSGPVQTLTDVPGGKYILIAEP